MEIKVSIVIEAPELTAAINNLAASLSGIVKTAPELPATSTLKTAPELPATSTPTPAPTAVPTAPPPQYTKEQIMQAGAELMDAGKANELVTLLRTFSVRSVMDLKPEQLGAFATAMRELGAKI